MLNKLNKLGLSVVLLSVFVSFSASATWTSYEYRNVDGDYRYGIRQGSEHIQLDQKDRKKARKAAKKLNKAVKKDGKSVRDTNEEGCNEPGVVC